MKLSSPYYVHRWWVYPTMATLLKKILLAPLPPGLVCLYQDAHNMNVELFEFPPFARMMNKFVDTALWNIQERVFCNVQQQVHIFFHTIKNMHSKFASRECIRNYLFEWNKLYTPHVIFTGSQYRTAVNVWYIHKISSSLKFKIILISLVWFRLFGSSKNLRIIVNTTFIRPNNVLI